MKGTHNRSLECFSLIYVKLSKDIQKYLFPMQKQTNSCMPYLQKQQHCSVLHQRVLNVDLNSLSIKVKPHIDRDKVPTHTFYRDMISLGCH